MNLVTTNEPKVAIYCRLSVDDGNYSLESSSISHQKDFISKYVMEKGWEIVNTYVDDGYSGTNFERPGFKELLYDIDRGMIDTVVVKDLSRLGRNYLQTGFYLETYFKDKGIRFIAINDGVDSLEKEDEFVPFKNIMNEWYAKDVSRKIRFSIQNNIRKGKPCKTPIPLYGYMYNDKAERIPDPVTSPVVVRIFNLYINGFTPSKIASILEEDKILAPRFYNFEKYNYGETNPKTALTGSPYSWTSDSITKIVRNREYTGDFIRGKRRTRFKSNHVTITPVEELVVFENRYEGIISKTTFEQAEEINKYMKNRYSCKAVNRYSGLAFCACCGERLRHKKDIRVNDKDFIRLTCRNKLCGKEKGTITYEDLDKVIKKEIMRLKDIILKNKDAFLALAKEMMSGSKAHIRTNIYEDEKRSLEANISKIDKYIRVAFEQYNNGLLPESSYQKMMKNYSEEQTRLEQELHDITLRIEEEKDDNVSYVNDANELITKLESLTPQNCILASNLNAIISKILVKTDGVKKRREKMNKEITIIYKRIDPLIKEFIDESK